MIHYTVVAMLAKGVISKQYEKMANLTYQEVEKLKKRIKICLFIAFSIVKLCFYEYSKI